MIELTADCFNDICNDPAVRAQLGSLETNRAAAVGRFWLWTAGSLVLAVAAYASLYYSGWHGLAFFVAFFLAVIGLAMGFTALSKVAEGLKQPVLQALAAKAGVEYLEKGFSPPAYPEARKALFGSWLSTETF